MCVGQGRRTEDYSDPCTAAALHRRGHGARHFSLIGGNLTDGPPRSGFSSSTPRALMLWRFRGSCDDEWLLSHDSDPHLYEPPLPIKSNRNRFNYQIENMVKK